MSERYDALAVRRYKDGNGNDKTAYTNIGVAFPLRDKDGYSLRLHAIPAPQDGEYSILLVPPKPKDDSRQQNRTSTRQQPDRNMSREMDDDIPF